MSFLQPMLLGALPLIALPVVIHLMNQRRYQTVRWAAMMFLLAANRMSRGYAQLRQWLILFFRALAIAGLVFAISRPIASGWFGMTAGGSADTTIILLDRSPSMQQQGHDTVSSKLETGRRQLARTLAMLGSAHWVLIDSASNLPREINSPHAIINLPVASPTSVSADLPAMLETARDYIRNNQCGRTEIWICSDVRQNDWNPDSARWQPIRESFREFSQSVRFRLLAYTHLATDNISVRVTDVRRRRTRDGAELLISLRLARESRSTPDRDPDQGQGRAPETGKQSAREEAWAAGRSTVPLQFELEGARSELTIEMDGPELELKDHRISLDRTRQRGWGRVSIPADSNLGDNDSYFVFDEAPVRHALIVSEDGAATRALQLAAAIAPDPSLQCAVEVIAPEQLATIDFNPVALVIWRAPLPAGDAASTIQAFVERGGQVLFFPPRSSHASEFMGTRWLEWSEEKDAIAIETWRGDQDVLENTQSGATLPVGELQVHRFRRIAGELTPLATLKGGHLLLGRVPTLRGGVYFCTTGTAPSDSSLASAGVVLYVLVQRALAAGSAMLGNTRQLVAGDVSLEQPTTWNQIAGSPDTLSTEFAYHSGVYSVADRLLAVNRSAAEDHAPILADKRVAALFQGLDFARVDDRAGSITVLIQEIWRLFLATMVVALLVEAALCLPKIARPTHAAIRSPAPGGPTTTYAANRIQAPRGPTTTAATSPVKQRTYDLRSP